MRADTIFILVVFALAVATLSWIKPVKFYKTDLSAIFLYWPEAYAYAERGDPTAVYRVTSLVTCATSGAIAAPPGIAFVVLGMSCRLKP